LAIFFTLNGILLGQFLPWAPFLESSNRWFYLKHRVIYHGRLSSTKQIPWHLLLLKK
jgi:hypothetical protein